MFDWSVFATVLAAGLVFAFIFLYIARSIGNMSNTDRIEMERQILAEYQHKIDRLENRVMMLENQVKSIRTDVDMLHDALIEDLNKPARRVDQ